MTIKAIHLNKLLKLMYLPEKELIRELKRDVKSLKKGSEKKSGGGSFYDPWWSDAKKHILGLGNLTDMTQQRIADNGGRKNLYEKLDAGFLAIWKRGDNQSIILLPHSPKGKYIANGNEMSIKVENIMAISIDGVERVICPYWFPEPTLSSEAARVGLWIMTKALNKEISGALRIFDVMRSEYFSLDICPLDGKEESIFNSHLQRILALRAKLMSDEQ